MMSKLLNVDVWTALGDKDMNVFEQLLEVDERGALHRIWLFADEKLHCLSAGKKRKINGILIS